MKNIFFILLFICNYCFAQTDPPIYQQTIPTQFDLFVNKPAIKWAIYANDTIRFNNPNLSEILIKKMKGGLIKTATPIDIGTAEANNIHYRTLQENEITLTIPVFDSVGVIIARRPMHKVDSFSYNLLNIIQVLYIENGHLKSYIPWVSPMYSVYLSTGNYIGRAQYFNTCFNFQYNFTSLPKDKTVFLGQTKRKIYSDSILKTAKLKELYGRNLLESLWPAIIEKKLPLYSVDSNKLIAPDQIMSFLMSLDSTVIPTYDSVGNIATYYRKGVELSDAFFKESEIIQNWYYDYTKNIVYNKIAELYIYAKRWENGEEEKESSPILKVIFKEN